MKKNYIICIIFLFLFLGCNTQEKIIVDTTKYENGLLVAKDYLWRLSTSNNYNQSRIKPLILKDDYILIGTQEGNNCQISSVNINTGEIRWQKNENENGLYISDMIYNDYVFIYKTIQHELRAFDLETGNILWTRKSNNWISPFIGGNNKNFVFGSEGVTDLNENRLQSLWLGENNTGLLTEISKANTYDQEVNFEVYGGAGGYDIATLFTNKENDDCIISSGLYYLKDNSIYNFFDVYNIAKKEFSLTNVVLSNLPCSFPQIIDEVAYFALFQEFCAYDLCTGEKLWGRNYESFFDENDFIIHDSTIFALQEGVNDYLISLDRFSGRENWKKPARQASSYIHYLEGVIYYTNGNLYAYDATNGQQLWSIESPDGTLFGSDCYAIPGKNGGKGKIIAGTGLHAYCYEAER